MTTIPIRCPEAGCDGVVKVDKSRHDEDHDVLIGLECPRCGADAWPTTFKPEQAWFGDRAPSDQPVFKPARCTNPDCEWEGPKS